MAALLYAGGDHRGINHSTLYSADQNGEKGRFVYCIGLFFLLQEEFQTGYSDLADSACGAGHFIF